MAVPVRLMNEYTVEWPLWTTGGLTREGELPVSELLAQELKAWARTFDEHYHWESGWDRQEVAEAHAKEAVRLRRALQADLGPQYEITLDLWECSSGT